MTIYFAKKQSLSQHTQIKLVNNTRIRESKTDRQNILMTLKRL